MDIRLLEQADIPQAKALWSEAFGDSDAFIDWYFANKVIPGNSLGMFDGRLVSVVHMIPVNVRVQGKALKSAFIAGAATAKDRRGEGLMRTLLYESLKLMKRRGVTLTHLYPFKHSFYENFGWATYSYAHFRSAEKRTACAADITESGDLELLAPLYERMMSAFDGYIVRGSREWRWRMEEHAADGGKTAVLLKDGAPSAYMLYNSVKGRAGVIETVYSDEQDIRPLLAYILANGHSGVDYFLPAGEGPGASPYGMARVVDAQALLEAFNAEDILEHARIRDGFVEWNNIGEGEELSITDLAKVLHQGNRMNDSDNVKPSMLHNILMKHFLLRSTCIFEQY